MSESLFRGNPIDNRQSTHRETKNEKTKTNQKKQKNHLLGPFYATSQQSP
jgi:hypothetical protein